MCVKNDLGGGGNPGMSLNMEGCSPGMCKVAPTPVSVNPKTVPQKLSVSVLTVSKVHYVTTGVMSEQSALIVFKRITNTTLKLVVRTPHCRSMNFSSV